MKQKKYLKIFLVASIVFSIVVFIFPFLADAAYNYEPMERIPGFESGGSDFPSFIQNLYKFGIWIVGICALLMVTVGGFMYLISAGNTAKMDTAKKIIFDSLLGLIIALGAYFLLFIINPDLVNVNISLEPFSSLTSERVGIDTSVGTTTATCSDGKCSKIDSAISSNSSGVDGSLLKALFVGGEGCNSANSPAGACGYSQVMPIIRKAYCNNLSCDQLRSDIQADINCGAAYVKKELNAYCKGEPKCTGACYNLGITKCKANSSACGERNYCQRVLSYYNSCK